MNDPTETRQEIDALREMEVPEYLQALSELRSKLTDSGDLEQYKKHIADVKHQMQKKIHEHARQDFFKKMLKVIMTSHINLQKSLLQQVFV